MKQCYDIALFNLVFVMRREIPRQAPFKQWLVTEPKKFP